jgi:asparagine synthase (glutamine-hydrolysing)
MCGIAGFVSTSARAGDREPAVGRMCEAMVHRGPDDAGMVSSGDATLGMRRLAIFDPAHGHQPMAAEEGRFQLVFNGSIYNHRELRAELESAGRTFRTHCDTEVLLAAFIHWGSDCLRRLRGMFAFAVWDQASGGLFLARDAFGIKPLYYHQREGRMLFASEVNALLASGCVAEDIDPRAVADYLGWLAVPGPRTIRRSVQGLGPGECAEWRAGGLTVRSWWSLADLRRRGTAPGTAARSRADYTAGLRVQLEGTIRAHLLADVPVGAFLSGGLDSSIVVALMLRAGATGLKTFSLGFGEAAYSEAAAAAETARRLGTDHHASILTGAEVAADLDDIVAAMDQPTGDGINTFYVSRAAHAGGVKAALSGLGGDELFGGYPAFRRVPRLARWLPWWFRLPPGARRTVLSRLDRGRTPARRLGAVLRHARDVHGVASLQRQVMTGAERRALLHPDLRSIEGEESAHHPQFDRLREELADTDPFSLVSGWELRTYMADVLLRDSDTMSMRHSLELRVPFVDRPLLEWLWAQPTRFKEDRRRPKSGLARAVADVLPADALSRPKRGFTLPLGLWMRRELRPFMEDTFAPASVARSGLFAVDTVRQRWSSFLSGNDDRAWSRVWSLAILIAFVNRRPRAAALA